MLCFSRRVPTCSPTPQACQMIPSLEQATCGPLWSHLATPLLTTTQMRSPHHTAREVAKGEEHTWAATRCCEVLSEQFSASELFFGVVWKYVEEKQVRKRTESEHTNLVQHKAECSLGTTHTLASTMYVCTYTWKQKRERQPDQCQDRLHICLP